MQHPSARLFPLVSFTASIRLARCLLPWSPCSVSVWDVHSLVFRPLYIRLVAPRHHTHWKSITHPSYRVERLPAQAALAHPSPGPAALIAWVLLRILRATFPHIWSVMEIPPDTSNGTFTAISFPIHSSEWSAFCASIWLIAVRWMADRSCFCLFHLSLRNTSRWINISLQASYPDGARWMVWVNEGKCENDVKPCVKRTNYWSVSRMCIVFEVMSVKRMFRGFVWEAALEGPLRRSRRRMKRRTRTRQIRNGEIEENEI